MNRRARPRNATEEQKWNGGENDYQDDIFSITYHIAHCHTKEDATKKIRNEYCHYVPKGGKLQEMEDVWNKHRDIG